VIQVQVKYLQLEKQFYKFFAQSKCIWGVGGRVRLSDSPNVSAFELLTDFGTEFLI